VPILLVGLLFSNSAFASREDSFEKRCKVEYTQLDLITGVENIYKNTSQFFEIYHCKEGLEKLSKKVYKWLDKNHINIIAKINAFQCKVKSVDRRYFIYKTPDWGKYRDCKTYIPKLSAYLVDKYPNQIGASIYKEFNSIETPIVD
jgi:hypothetical protein